jgi:D-alanyl-D-alanine dipeptidase
MAPRLTLPMMKFRSFLLIVLVGASVCAHGRARAAGSPDALAHSTQALVVTTADWNAVEGEMRLYKRTTVKAAWRMAGGPIPVVVGKSGLGWGIGVPAGGGTDVRIGGEPVKKEGDGRSPAGIFALGTAFGYAPQPLPDLKLPYLPLTPSIECVDDVHSKYYNQVLDRSTVTPDWNSSEHMRDTGESYRWGVVVDHNGTVARRNDNTPEPGGGSCIFLHIWRSRDQGTVGCTAMAQSNLEEMMTWLDPQQEPLLVQLPRPVYRRLARRWMLPKIRDASPR